jgi:hypothetical protein
MSTKRSAAHSTEDDLLELDRLVLAEIESLTSGQRGVPAPDSSADALRDEECRAKPARQKGLRRAGVVDMRETPESSRALSGEEAEGLFDDLPADPGPEPEPDDEAPAASLLTPEEEAFITRAVGFLSQRKHADMILGRIWEQLTELAPEGFYEAPMVGDMDGAGLDPPSEDEAATAPPEPSNRSVP